MFRKFFGDMNTKQIVYLVLAGASMSLSLFYVEFFGISLLVSFVIATLFTISAIRDRLGKEVVSYRYTAKNILYTILVPVAGFMVGFYPLSGLSFVCGAYVRYSLWAGPIILLSVFIFYWFVSVGLPSRMLSKPTRLPFSDWSVSMVAGYLFLTHAPFVFSFSLPMVDTIFILIAVACIILTPFFYFKTFIHVLKNQNKKYSFKESLYAFFVSFFALYVLMYVFLAATKSLDYNCI